MVRKPTLLLALTLLASSCGAFIEDGPEANADSSLPPEVEGDQALVVDTVDGDTVIASINGRRREIRLLGVNAPEMWECHSLQATAALRGLVDDQQVVLTEAGAGDDQFGRALRYVWVEGVLVNEQMLLLGEAIAVSGDHARAADFAAAEDEAARGLKGLWAPAACGRDAEADLVVAEVFPDPEGPDAEDLNGEWVAIINRSPAPVLMAGWVLRDESSVHRFEFPASFVVPGDGTIHVLAGCGTDTTVTLHWCATGPVFNNLGDSALLLDPSGNIHSRFSYGPGRA